MKVLVVSDEVTRSDFEAGKVVEGVRKWDSRPYYLLNKVLSSSEFDVRFVDYDSLSRMAYSGELTFVHVDRTFVSENLEEVLEGVGVAAWNGKMRDNSKRRIERVFEELTGRTLKVDKGYSGPVVVKPNHNAGDPEGNQGYTFVDKVDLDGKLLFDPGWVVERQVRSYSDQTGVYHQNRRFIIFGNELFLCELYSVDNKVKQKTSLWQFYRPLEDLERDFGIVRGVCLNDLGVHYRELNDRQKGQVKLVKKMAKRLKLDFGSIDLIEAEDGDYIIDVNKTPWERGFPEHFLTIVRNGLMGGGK